MYLFLIFHVHVCNYQCNVLIITIYLQSVNNSLLPCTYHSNHNHHSADKKLFTPGPLGTSATVKQAMLRDLGSRDVEFINLVKSIRSGLVEIAGGLMLSFYVCNKFISYNLVLLLYVFSVTIFL